MRTTKRQLRRVIRESFEWSPEMKAKWKDTMDVDRQNVERVHGVGRMNPDVVYDQLSQTIPAGMHASETYLDFVFDALDHENWPAAVNAILDALWIDDIPVAADEVLETMLMDVQSEDGLAGAVAEWVPRYWKVSETGRIMGRK